MAAKPRGRARRQERLVHQGLWQVHRQRFWQRGRGTYQGACWSFGEAGHKKGECPYARRPANSVQNEDGADDVGGVPLIEGVDARIKNRFAALAEDDFCDDFEVGNTSAPF